VAMSRSNLAKRLARLEQSDIFAGPKQLMSRLDAALNGAALRITGKFFRAAPHDKAIRKRIYADLEERFIRNLSDAELDNLGAELGRSIFGADAAALEAFKKEAMELPTTDVLHVESEALAEW
jgi:hypothetical protein